MFAYQICDLQLTMAPLRQVVHVLEQLRPCHHARRGVWGHEVYDGTTVKGDYVLHDQDIVELHA